MYPTPGVTYWYLYATPGVAYGCCTLNSVKWRVVRAGVVAALIMVGALVTPLAQSEHVDSSALARIREEGLRRSQVMDTLS